MSAQCKVEAVQHFPDRRALAVICVFLRMVAVLTAALCDGCQSSCRRRARHDHLSDTGDWSPRFAAALFRP